MTLSCEERWWLCGSTSSQARDLRGEPGLLTPDRRSERHRLERGRIGLPAQQIAIFPSGALFPSTLLFPRGA